MTSETIRDPVQDHLLAPQNSELIINPRKPPCTNRISIYLRTFARAQ